VPPTTHLEQGAPSRSRGSRSSRVPACDYVRLAQGFYFVFWGLLLTVLTGVELLMLIDMPPFAESLLVWRVLTHADWVVAIVPGAQPGRILAATDTLGRSAWRC